MCTQHHLTHFPSGIMADSKERQPEGGKSKSKKLLYAPVPIVREKELPLVRECADHLGPFGLTLWVVSMSMPKNCDTGFPCGMPFFSFVCCNFWTYIVD